MTTYEIVQGALLVFTLCLAVTSAAKTWGILEERRRWRFAAETVAREILVGDTMYIVMRREVFWREWHNPLVKARRESQGRRG